MNLNTNTNSNAINNNNNNSQSTTTSSMNNTVITTNNNSNQSKPQKASPTDQRRILQNQSIPNTNNYHYSNRQISFATKRRKKPRRWTEEEQNEFQRGLEIYGRDWQRISEMPGIDDRPKESISSHAQAYFIKLWKMGSSLPEKVKESGEGYTLSGKPLDPNSASVVRNRGRKSQRTRGPGCIAQNIQHFYERKARKDRKRRRKRRKHRHELIEVVDSETEEQNKKCYEILNEAFKDNSILFMKLKVTNTHPAWRCIDNKDETYHRPDRVVINPDEPKWAVKRNRHHKNRNSKQRKIGISYSYPMDKEGLTDEKTKKHLAPIWIRPPSLYQFKYHENDVNFRMWFNVIWFSNYQQLQQMIITPIQFYTQSPFDLLTLQFKKMNINQDTNDDYKNNIQIINPKPIKKKVQSMKAEMDDSDYDIDDDMNENNINIKYDNASNVQKIRINYRKGTDNNIKFDNHFVPEMYNAMSMPIIDKQLVQNRKFHVVYICTQNKQTVPTNKMLKRWSLVDGDTRREILTKENGVYRCINNLYEMFSDFGFTSRIMRQCVFLIHFKYNPCIGIQTFGNEFGLDEILNISDVVLCLRFMNASGYLSKDEKQRNNLIKKFRKQGQDLYLKRKIPKWKVKMFSKNDDEICNISINSEFEEKKKDIHLNMAVNDKKSMVVDDDDESDKDFKDLTLISENEFPAEDKNSIEIIRKRKMYDDSDDDDSEWNSETECEPRSKRQRIDTRSNSRSVETNSEIQMINQPLKLLSKINIPYNILPNHNGNINFDIEEIKESVNVVLRTKQNVNNCCTTMDVDSEDMKQPFVLVNNDNNNINFANGSHINDNSSSINTIQSQTENAQFVESDSKPLPTPIPISVDDLMDDDDTEHKSEQKSEQKLSEIINDKNNENDNNIQHKSQQTSVQTSEQTCEQKSSEIIINKKDDFCIGFTRAKLKTTKRLNVKIELIVGYDIYSKKLDFFHQNMLNSIIEYFADYLTNKLLPAYEDEECPFYSIYTRDCFDFPLKQISKQETVKDRTFTKKTFFMQQSKSLNVDYLWWINNSDNNNNNNNDESDNMKQEKNIYKYNKDIEANICSDCEQSDAFDDDDIDTTDPSDNEQKESHHNNNKSNTNNATEMCVDIDIDETDNKNDVIILNDLEDDEISNEFDNREENVSHHVCNGIIRDRMINGKRCVWIGATAYPDLFSEQELKNIEGAVDKLQARAEANQHKKFTSQGTKSRKGILVRTKHFFGARYLWHLSEFANEGKDKRVGNGLRVDVDKIPESLFELVETKLVYYGVINPNWCQGIAFNMYHDGTEGIGPHFDDAARFDRPIVTVRLFSDARIAFGTDLYGTSNGLFSVPLPRGMVLKMERNGFAVDGIKHTVRPCDMFEKSAAIILRRFQKQALDEARKLHLERMNSGYYTTQKYLDRNLYRGRKPKSKSNNDDDYVIYGGYNENKYVENDGFCVPDDFIEYDDTIRASDGECVVNVTMNDKEMLFYGNDDLV